VNSFIMLADIIDAISKSNVGAQSYPKNALELVELPDSINEGEEMFSYSPKDILQSLYVYSNKAHHEILAAKDIDDSLIAVAKARLKEVQDFLADIGSGQQWQYYKSNYLNGSLEDGLRLAGGMIGAAGVKSKLNNSLAKDYLNDVRKVLDKINEGDLPIELKQILVASLLKIQFLLETYPTFGPRDIEDQAKVLLADCLIGSQQIPKNKSGDLESTLKLTHKILETFHTGVGYLQSSEYVVGLLMLLEKKS